MPQLSRKHALSQKLTGKFKSPMVTLQSQGQEQEHSDNSTSPTKGGNKQLTEDNEKLNDSITEELNKSIEKLFKEISYNENSAQNSENRLSQEVLNSEPMKTKYLQFWNITPTKELMDLSQPQQSERSNIPTGKENSVTPKSQSLPSNKDKINTPASIDKNKDDKKSKPSELTKENDNPMNSTLTSVEKTGKSISLEKTKRRNTLCLTPSLQEMLEGCTESSKKLNDRRVKQAYINYVGSLSRAKSPNLDDIFQEIACNDESRENLNTSQSQEVLNTELSKKRYREYWNKIVPSARLETPKTEKEIRQRSGKKTSAKKEQTKLPETPVKRKLRSKIIDKIKTPEKNATKKLRKKRTKTTEMSKNVKADKSSTKGSDKNKKTKEYLLNVDRMRLIHESRNVGLYVLCDSCDKARYLSDVKDPLELTQKWYCKMNSDKTHNKCSDPEEVEEDEEFLIYNLYNSGSIVWAKLNGFPWWPAMVEDDPDIEEFFWIEKNIVSPTYYHVSFFDSERVTRAWIKTSNLKAFKYNDKPALICESELTPYYWRLKIATRQARDALELPLINRLRKYSFIYRYKPTSKKTTKKSADSRSNGKLKNKHRKD